MVNKCCVVGCFSNYSKHDVVPVFSFPVKKELRTKWIKFVNRLNWVPTKSSVICAKHFQEKYLKHGEQEKRFRLIKKLKPVPTIHPSVISKSSIPTINLERKSPTKRIYQNDQRSEFLKNDLIKNLNCITDIPCPSGYQMLKHNDHIVFYKMLFNEFSIPEVIECIRVDESLHVKLFYKGCLVPLPKWFCNGHNCTLTRKSMFENFPPYLRSQAEKNFSVFEELEKIKYQKKPIYSGNLIRYALLLRYTSMQSYKVLLEEFRLPSLSLLNKICSGNIDALKAAKLLLENGKMSQDVSIIFDEMYIQKCAEYSSGTITGVNSVGELYKSVICFMINSFKENIPYIIKAIPVVQIDSDWLKNEILETLNLLHNSGFVVRAIVCDNHASNVSAFNKLLSEYGNGFDSFSILYNCRKVYLFYDAVHLIKNVRNNLLNRKRFLFPPFEFIGFKDKVTVKGGEVSWKLFHDVHEKDLTLDADLRKAPKLTNKVLHPGKYKQNVQVALDLFNESTIAGLKSYFPLREDAVGFLELFNKWWIIANSKNQFSPNNYLGNAAILNDKKPEFLRAMALWIDNWEKQKIMNCEKFVMSAQTSSAFKQTLNVRLL